MTFHVGQLDEGRPGESRAHRRCRRAAFSVAQGGGLGEQVGRAGGKGLYVTVDQKGGDHGDGHGYQAS